MAAHILQGADEEFLWRIDVKSILRAPYGDAADNFTRGSEQGEG